jgi:hypothetical protein
MIRATLTLTTTLTTLLGLMGLVVLADRPDQPITLADGKATTDGNATTDGKATTDGDAATDGNAATIERLIAQLGHPHYRLRQQASQRLEALGSLALPALTQACQHANQEIAHRAANLVTTIRHRIEQQALLKPCLVHLQLHNATLDEAIRELARQSGYRIALDEGAAKQLAQRPITLDTGQVSFWEAVDRLARHTQLIEMVQVQPWNLDAAAGRGEQNGPAAGGVVIVVNGQVQVLQRPVLPVPLPGQQPKLGQPAPAAAKADVIFGVGKRPELPTDYVGSVRVQAIPLGYEPPRQPGQSGSRQPIIGPEGLSLFLHLALEPRLRWHSLTSLIITRAVDNHGQALQPLAAAVPPASASPPPPPPGGIVPRDPPPNRIAHPPTPVGEVRVALAHGTKRSQILRELNGIAMLQVRTAPEALATVEDILDEQAGRRRVVGAGGVALQVNGVEKLETGCRVQINLELPATVLVEPDPTNSVGSHGITLLDTHGQPIRPGGLFRQQLRQVNGVNLFSFEMRFHYFAEAPQVPKTLQVRGSRLLPLDMPFSLRDIRVD